MQTTPPTQGEMQQARALLLRQIPLSESSESQIADGLLALRTHWIAPRRTSSRRRTLSVAHRGTGASRFREMDPSRGSGGSRSGAPAAQIAALRPTVPASPCDRQIRL